MLTAPTMPLPDDILERVDPPSGPRLTLRDIDELLTAVADRDELAAAEARARLARGRRFLEDLAAATIAADDDGLEP